MKNLKPFKIRCSCIGKIMTNPRSKTETLSQTTKSYVDEWIMEQVYGVRNELTSKYFDKGNENEDEAIELLALNDNAFYVKNQKYFENEFMTGTPDVITETEILDTKCPWNCFTFPLLEDELKNKDYYYQMQGYMYLTKLDKARVAYVLTNTPAHLSYTELDQKDYNELDLKLRIKSFTVNIDMEVIEKIHARVLEIREYINEKVSKL